MRVVPHDLAVLAGARLELVGIDDEIARPPVSGLLGHERPLEPGREARAAAAAQPRGLHLLDDPVAALLEELLGAVPLSARHGALQPPVVEAVEIGEDAVLVGKHGYGPGLSMDPRVRPEDASLRSAMSRPAPRFSRQDIRRIEPSFDPLPAAAADRHCWRGARLHRDARPRNRRGAQPVRREDRTRSISTAASRSWNAWRTPSTTSFITCAMAILRSP